MKKVTVEVPTPWPFLKPRLQKVPCHICASFFAAAFSAFFAHLFFFTGQFANEDNLHYMKYSAWHIGSGRWADKVRLTGEYLLPVVMFSLFILSLALTVCITIHLLRIRRMGTCVLLAFGIPAFPCLAVGNGYLFMVEVYSIAILFAALAVLVTRHYRFGWLPGALLLAVSMGEYQSYVALAMTLCLMSITIEFLLQELEKRDLFGLVVRYLLMGVLGVGCYFIILRLLLKSTGQELLSYKGIDSMGRIPLSQLPGLLIRTYRDFAAFFLGKKFIAADGLLLAAYLCLGLLCVGLLAMIVVRRKLYKQPAALLFLTVLLLLFPLCANVVDLVAPESSTSIINLFAYAMVLPFTCAIAELAGQFTPDAPRVRNCQALAAWGLLAILIIVDWNWFLQTNIFYSKINSYYEHTVLMCNRILSRIERLPAFSQGAEVAFIIDDNGVDYLFSNGTDYNDIILNDQGLWDPVIGFYRQKDAAKPATLISNICGVQINVASQSRIEEIKKTDAYQALDAWPTDGCIDVIDGVIVVNFICLNAVVELQDDILVFDIEDKSEVVDQTGTVYAWYVYRNGERINTRWYDASSAYSYEPEAAGEYYGLVFIKREDGNTVTYTTPTVMVP